MKRVLLNALIAMLFVVTSCASSPHRGMTYSRAPNEPSYIEQKQSYKEVEFNGKSYSLIFNDEFTDSEVDFSKWSASNVYTVEMTETAKCGDGSWLGSKIWGNSKHYNNIILNNIPRYAVTCMGQRVYEQKDGVLHMRAVQEKRGNDWYMFLPGISSTQTFEIGTLYEIRYKLPVKGEDRVLHMQLSPADENYLTNEQGYTFREMFFCEMLTGKKDYVQYNPSMWIGKKVRNKQYSNIDNAVPDFQRDIASKFDFNNPYNVLDDNPTYYKVSDEDFYEWHTATCVYDEERFAIYHDGVLTYEWKWDEWEKVGKPQNWNGIEGARRIFVGYGLAGDWAAFFDNGDLKAMVGKFDDVDKVLDFQIDYVRVWHQN